MKKLILAASGFLLTAGIAFAQAPAPSPSGTTAATPVYDCSSHAMDKHGKPLAGAARTSFMKKCEADHMSGSAANCEMKAVDKHGKPLAGAAKNSFMKKCEAHAKK